MNRMLSLVIKLVSLGLLLYFLVGISRGIYQNKKDIKTLKVRVEAQEKANEKLRDVENNMLKRIDNLKDPKEIEKIAREVLNMKKSDEVIYRVIDNK